MTVVLFRVDERLIHGQVVVGWGTRLRPDRIVVIDDDLSASAWEQELYTLGLPGEIEAAFRDVESARAELAAWQNADEKIIVLTRDLNTMRRLAEQGIMNGREVNLGGIHHAAGREQVLPYLYLGTGETEQLERLREEGVEVTAQDLPGSRRVAASELLRQG